LSPGLPDGALQLAMALQRLGKQQESIPYFEKALAQEAGNTQALTNLGLALTETGKAGEAVPYLQRALAETPNDPVAHEDMGVAQLQQSHFDESIVQFQRALELDAANPQLHYDLGLAYKLKDRTDDAVRELAKAASLDPTLPDPPYTLGILYMQIGRLDDAAMQLKAALALRPANGDGWAILGSILKQMNQPERREETEAALRKAIALLPNQPGPHITLAALLTEEGKRDAAAQERKLAAGLSRSAVNHQRAMLNTNAGNQMLLRGQIADAVEKYQEAIAADPSYAEAHSQLALAYERQGRAEEAAAERAKADALSKAK
jgi:tetratricopeptide (TPR) repeat protein